MHTTTSIKVRGAEPDDRDFVMLTVRRLADFEVPGWRTPREIWEGEARTLQAWFEGAADGTLLVADRDRAALGFIYLERHTDYFTAEEHGHVGILAVAEHAEGTGAGRALLQAAEAWARDRKYRRLTLNVFEGNARARAVYERMGFAVETIRYTKSL